MRVRDARATLSRNRVYAPILILKDPTKACAEQDLPSVVVGHYLPGTTHISVIFQNLFNYRTPSRWCAPPMNPSELIDKYIADLTDWRGKMIANLRNIIHDADPEIIEEWKWMGTPVWSHNGLILVANAHKDKVKLTFSRGASLPDPDKLFNAGLEGNKWRAIDLYEGDRINERALRDIIRAAVAYNGAGAKGKTPAVARGIARAHGPKPN